MSYRGRDVVGASTLYERHLHSHNEQNTAVRRVFDLIPAFSREWKQQQTTKKGGKYH